MPNWIKGDLKVRGTKGNIKKFLLEGLEPIVYFGSEQIETEIVCDDEWEFIIKSERGFYIKETRRNFIESECIETYINDLEDDEEGIVVLYDYSAAWGIDAQSLAEISRKYSIDFKILGFERGMQFNQDIEIIKGEIIKGEIIKDKEIKFNNYEWECIRPHIGG